MIRFLPNQIRSEGRTSPAEYDQQSRRRLVIDWQSALKCSAIVVVGLCWLVGSFGGYVQSVGVTICPSTIEEEDL